MNIPDKVKIGAYNYSIIIDDKLALKNGTQGTQCANTLEIKLDAGIALQNRESTLLHEIIEAINYHYELKIEHHVISTLESTLYQVIKDNPDIFKEECKNEI